MSDFPRINLTSQDGAHVEFYLHGGHITSWKPAKGNDQLFLSKNSEFNLDTAIRGGVPVCFPQFASEGPILKHGFARLSMWELISTKETGDSAQAILQLKDSATSLEIWPHAFLMTLTITIGGPRLIMEINIKNTGSTSFEFTGALHTYLYVDDIADTSISNLQGCHYRDSALNIDNVIQNESELCFVGEVDRIYKQAPTQVIVNEPKKKICVQSTGFTDVVIWNPGPEKCAALADMETEGYRNMVCVEAAAVEEPVTVPPGESWTGTQELIAV